MAATLRGIWHRRGRSLIVVLLAMIATAAAVVIPAYTRAAQQSVLTDTLTAARPVSAGLTATVKLSGQPDKPQDDAYLGTGPNPANGGDESAVLAETRQALDKALAAHPTLGRRLAEPVGTLWFDKAAIIPAPGPAAGDLVYRQGVCDHLEIVAGSCAAGAGQVLVSERSAKQLGWAPGAKLTVVPELDRGMVGLVSDRPAFTVSGLYRPRDQQDPYWGNTFYWSGLTEDPDTGVIFADALFVGSDAELAGVFPGPRLTLDYPLRAGTVRLDEVTTMRSDVNGVTAAVRDRASVASGLGPTVDSGDAQQAALTTSVPLVAVPLVLLCWFVLFLVVAALTEERGPEIALGKLRGLGMGQVAGFGLAEPLLLVLVAAPLGLALGLGLTALGAEAFLADGVTAELRTPVLVVAAVALAGAVLAAAFATRRTVRASVLALLRRVPPRAPWRAAVVEAAVGVLALVALYQVVFVGDRGSPLAYAAPPLLAVVAGLAAARVLGWWARRRVRSAAEQGQLPAMLAAAQVARRPATARVVALLAMAVALLGFAAAIWDVAGVNREIAARAETGAGTVYSVAGTTPGALISAVREADPDGRRAMAVAWGTQRYSGTDLRVAGVDAQRLAAVASWPGRDAAGTAALARLLRPEPAGPVALRGPELEVTATVNRLQRTDPVRLGVVVAGATQPRVVALNGVLRDGTATYTGRLDGCGEGCRLLGLQVVRGAADFSTVTADLTVTALRDGGREVDARLGADQGWRAPSALPAGQRVDASASDGGLRVVASGDSGDMSVDYGDYPAATPVAVAGPPPTTDASADTFSFLGLGAQPSQMRVVDRGVALPRVGSPALLFDLETELAQVARTIPYDSTKLTYEVWATPDAGPALRDALAAAGLQITGETTKVERQGELARLAPALALRLYLLAGVVAALLAIGVLLLNARVGASARLRELAALRVVGVSGGTLRAALRREYVLVLAAPLLIGAVAGVGGAALLLPAIPLVSVGGGELPPVYRAGPWWVPGALLALVACLALAVAGVLRMVARADPVRLREGDA